MSDILIPSLFVGILLAFVYVNLYLAASFIELKNNPEARLKLNPKVVFLSVLLIYPLASVCILYTSDDADEIKSQSCFFKCLVDLSSSISCNTFNWIYLFSH